MKLSSLETLCSVFLAGTFALNCATSKYPQSVLNEKQTQSVAECLNEKNVIMYGAAWCNNCEQQKKYFGERFSLISYVECYEEFDGKERGQKSEECKEIRAFPAWDFSDGIIISGLRTPEDLAEMAGCEF